MNTITRLRKQNAELRAENARLRKQNSFLRQHKTLTAGMRGEGIVARIVEGKLTAITEDHDLLLRRKGRSVRIEVKTSKLNVAYTPRKTVTKRWSWRHVLGNSGGKKCQRVILVGDIDGRFRKQYQDPKSEYVFFDVPRSTAKRLMSKTDGLIQITTNPSAVEKGGKAAELFRRFEVTSRDLRSKYQLL